jgi:hypothetical protein
LTARAIALPERVRERARRSLDLLEEASTQIVGSVLDAGSRALNAAADYVSEVVPQRRVRRPALEGLAAEQVAWARCTIETLEQSASQIDDDALRVELLRAKLQTVRHAETATQLLEELRGRTREGDEMPRVQPVSVHGAGGPEEGRARHDLASALSAAIQHAEGWRALMRVAAAGEPERVTAALGRACEAVGREPENLVDLLLNALVQRTVDAMLA